MPYYALGLKGWVEVRKGRKPPVALKSEVKKEVFQEERVWDWASQMHGVPRGRLVRIPRTLKIRQLSFLGGKFITSFKKRTFYNRTRISSPVGSVITLSTEAASSLLGDTHG